MMLKIFTVLNSRLEKLVFSVSRDMKEEILQIASDVHEVIDELVNEIINPKL